MNEKRDEVEAKLEMVLVEVQEVLEEKIRHANAEDMVHLTEAIRNVTDSWCRMESIRAQKEHMREMRGVGPQVVGLRLPGQGDN